MRASFHIPHFSLAAANGEKGNRAILASVNASALEEGRRQETQYEHSSVVDKQTIHPDFDGVSY
jgi:hypothetical protein